MKYTFIGRRGNMDYIVETLNSSFFYYFFVASGYFLIVFGITLFIGIVSQGRILIIDFFFRKKSFDRFELSNLYKIQAIYTVLLGLICLYFFYFTAYDGVKFYTGLIVVAVLDVLYDFFAIRRASRY